MRMTPPITLTPVNPSDAPDVFDAVCESMSELRAWMPWCSADYSLGDAEQWIALGVDGRESGDAFEFIIRAPDGRLLGCCGLNQIRHDDRCANLGYWVRTSETGRGIAVAAAGLLSAWGFENTDLERLEIVPALSNYRSQRVAEAVGASREGVLASRLLLGGTFHDAVMYSIVRSQWSPAQDVPAARHSAQVDAG